MPDISMCADKTCTLRMNCFRYRAVPNPWRQSYSTFTSDSLDGMAANCDHYWDIKDATTLMNSIETLKLIEENMKNQESKHDPDKI